VVGDGQVGTLDMYMLKGGKQRKGQEMRRCQPDGRDEALHSPRVQDPGTPRQWANGDARIGKSGSRDMCGAVRVGEAAITVIMHEMQLEGHGLCELDF